MEEKWTRLLGNDRTWERPPLGFIFWRNLIITTRFVMSGDKQMGRGVAGWVGASGREKARVGNRGEKRKRMEKQRGNEERNRGEEVEDAARMETYFA